MGNKVFEEYDVGGGGEGERDIQVEDGWNR